MGERLLCKQDVASSILVTSTKFYVSKGKVKEALRGARRSVRLGLTVWHSNHFNENVRFILLTPIFNKLIKKG